MNRNPEEQEPREEEARPVRFDLDGASELFRTMAGSDAARTMGSSKRMSAEIRREAELNAELAKKEKYGSRVLLECTDVMKQYKQYDSVVTAVDRVNFNVLDGEFVAIIGTSGSGKSTLLHLCAGLDRPNGGTIRVAGQEITRMSADALGRFRGNNIGMIFQNHNLLPQFTAMENILVPSIMCNKPDVQYEENFRKLITTLHIADRLHHLPSELSGGQQQRVSIARALINRPQIVFADEPTGNLDRANADEVLELLLETKEQLNQTLVMVTHDLSIARRADRIFRMENGRLEPCKL